MTMRHSLGFIFAAAYLALCLLAVAYAVRMIVLSPGKFELAGIVILALGLPWSLIFAVTASALNISSAWLLAIGLIASCIVNVWLLYKLGAKLQSRHQ